MDLMPSDFAFTLPACAMIPNQQNFTRHDKRLNFSTIFWPSSRAAKLGKFALLSRAIEYSEIHLEVLSIQNRKCFEYFFGFHRTLGISPKDLQGFKGDIAFIHTTLVVIKVQN